MLPPAILLTFLVGCVDAQLFSSLVTEWFWQSAVAVGDFLYISGGSYYVSNGSYTTGSTSWAIDLSGSWTNQTMIFASQVQLPTDMIGVRQPLLFYDEEENTVNSWGGFPFIGTDFTSELWSFTPGSSAMNWVQRASPPSNGLSAGSPGPFASAYAFSKSKMYALGGNIFSDNSFPNMTVLPGLVTQDFFSQSWSNTSVAIPGQSEFRTQARAAFVPNFGDEGFLVVVGGENPPTDASVYEGGMFMVDMATITLYDIAKGKWYTQSATGEIPPPRSEFCVAGTPSGNGSTFELYVFGGSTNKTFDLEHAHDEGYLNVFALSLPAFRWFKSNSTTAVRRAGHTCAVIGNRQMISIGGSQPSSGQDVGLERDPWSNGIGVFDMTDFVWSDRFDSEAPSYESPRQVQDYYAKTYRMPSWSDPSLASVFEFPPTSDSTTNSTTSNHSGSSTPAIVGGVVGGVAALVLILSAAGLYRRRQRRRPAQTHASQDGNSRELKSGAYAPVPTELGATPPDWELQGSPKHELPQPETLIELPAADDTGGRTQFRELDHV